jgi:hypothetical protein
MRRFGWTTVGILLVAAGPAWAQTPQTAAPAEAPASVTLPVPVMSGPLALSPVPPAVDVGPLGTWYIDGVASGVGLVQSNAGPGDRSALADVSNGQVFIQKTDGLVRVYVQAGAYALPALGTSYTHQTDTTDTWNKLFGPVPQAFVKLAPNDAFSIQVGKLPTLIGAEGTFTFQNVNIERGLLWNQEPAVSRGVQANYTVDPLGFSLSLNDGFYSGHYTWLSGSASWNVNAANVLVFAAGGNLGTTSANTFATPLAQNNGSIYNLIYTYTQGPLMLTPYLQYARVAAHPAVGIFQRGASYGAAVLGSYALSKTVTLGARVEYETTSAGPAQPVPTNLLYGPGSSAASLTLTPTWTLNHWFVRADAAAVVIDHPTPHDGFGRTGTADTQFRGLLEAGYIF